MALSRPLDTSLLVASSSGPTHCRFCGSMVVTRTFVNLQSNQDYYRSALAKLEFMNIKVAKKLHMNVCHPCYHSFNKAYGFCQKFNRTQVLLADIYGSAEKDAKIAEKAPKKASDIKEEPMSSDEIDVDADSCVPIYNKKKKQFADLGKTWSSYTWTCCHCDAKFKELDKLRSHSQSKHGICYGFECPDCDIKLNEYDHFIDHVRNHKENLRFFCDVCDKPLPLKGRHNHTARQQSCFCCGELFPNRKAITKHHQSYKKRAIVRDNGNSSSYIITVPDLQLEDAQPVCDAFQSWKDYVWACNECDIKFHSASALRVHGEEVHNNCFTMKCVDCSATTDVFHKLIIHIMRHRPSLRHFCPFCDRLAHNDTSFRQHVRTHLTNSSYCTECGQVYAGRITTRDTPSMTSALWFLEPPGTTVELQERRPNQSLQTIQPTQPNQRKNTNNRKSKTNKRTRDNEQEGKKGSYFGKKYNEEESESEEKRSVSEESNDEEVENNNEHNDGNGEATGDGAEYLQALDCLTRNTDPLQATYVLPHPITCGYCKETFTDKRLYREHAQTRYCLICDRPYTCSKLQEEHLFSDHMADKPYECYKCGKCYRIRGNAFSCMQKHLTEETSMCKICNSMVLESCLAEHSEAHRYESSPQERVCGLGFCRQSFASWMELVNHRHSKHLTITFRKVHNNGRYLAQKNIGMLPEDEKFVET